MGPVVKGWPTEECWCMDLLGDNGDGQVDGGHSLGLGVGGVKSRGHVVDGVGDHVSSLQWVSLQGRTNNQTSPIRQLADGRWGCSGAGQIKGQGSERFHVARYLPLSS